MMKLAVIAANGKTGQRVVETALAHDLDVTAIVRHENRSQATQVLQKGIFDLTADDLAPFDVVVDAFGVYDPERLDEHQTTLAHLTSILSGTTTRLYIVGGAGSLYVDDEMTIQLKDTPEFPAAYQPLAESMSRGLAVLRQAESVHWIYVSPAAEYDSEGPRTGHYAFAGDKLTTNATGQSYISYADYVDALLQEILHPTADQQRISIYGI